MTDALWWALMVVNCGAWFWIGWDTRSRRLAKQSHHVTLLEAALRSEIERYIKAGQPTGPKVRPVDPDGCVN